jgi:hypothetical protein
LRLTQGLVLPEHVAEDLERVFFEHGVRDAGLSIEVDEVEVATKRGPRELDPRVTEATVKGSPAHRSDARDHQLDQDITQNPSHTPRPLHTDATKSLATQGIW